jgi:hypothetical protein
MGSNRGVFDKTSCASGAPPSMKIGSAASHVETGQLVIQASVVGDCLKVGSYVMTQIPSIRLTRAGKRYHLLSHPQTGRTHDSVCTRPAAQQSPPMEALCKL